MEKQYVDDGFPTDFPVVAPFLADLDTSGGRGQIYYRVTETPSVLNRVAQVCLPTDTREISHSGLLNQQVEWCVKWISVVWHLTTNFDFSFFFSSSSISVIHCTLWLFLCSVPLLSPIIHSFICSPRKYIEGSQMQNSHRHTPWWQHGRTWRRMKNKLQPQGLQTR